MARKSTFPTKTLFYGSISFPYLETLLLPQSLSVTPLLFDFFALLLLAISSVMLMVQTLRRSKHSWGMLYPICGAMAVILYFYSMFTLLDARDYMYFRLQQSRFESHIGLLTQKTIPADSLFRKHAVSPDNEPWYEVVAPGILLCTTGGEAGTAYWGYAYSPTDHAPISMPGGQWVDWKRLTGHWYSWRRTDGSSD
jgi:hypothetical protein